MFQLSVSSRYKFYNVLGFLCIYKDFYKSSAKTNLD